MSKPAVNTPPLGVDETDLAGLDLGTATRYRCASLSLEATPIRTESGRKRTRVALPQAVTAVLVGVGRELPDIKKRDHSWKGKKTHYYRKLEKQRKERDAKKASFPG